MNVRTRRHCAYCRLKKCFDLKMRKDWIRTNKETELRQLKKLAKEQKKLNQLTDDQQIILDLPIVMRKKKRLMIKPTAQKLNIEPVNINNLIRLIIFLCLLDPYTNIFWF
jgi:hypothetical protein